MRVTVLIVALLISGCNFKPRYCRPDMNVPESYRFAPSDNKEYVNLPWWEQFEDPALNELIEAALTNNQNLQVATARVLEFYSKYEVAFSQFFPQISASQTNDRIKNTDGIAFAPLSPLIPRIQSLHQLFMNLSYEFDFWGKIRNLSEAARADYLAQVDSRNTTIVTLASAIATAYIQLLQFDYQLEISQLTYQSRVESLVIAKLRFDAGLTSEMEVKQAESEAQAAKVQIKNFDIFIPIQENLISILIGTPPEPISRGKILTTLKLPKSLPVGLPSTLLDQRPDIKQAEQNMISANARIGVARSAFLPIITLTGAQGRRSSNFDLLLKNKSDTFDWGIGALQPVFTGGKLTGRLSEAEAIYIQTVHAYQQTVLTAFQEVSDALITHEITQEKLAEQLKQQEALTEYLRLAKLRYFNGQNDYLTVVDSEKNLFQVQLLTGVTAGDIFISLVELYKALGQGWDVGADYCSKCDDPSPLMNVFF